ncbi:metal-dependent hydrolase [Massilibacterium senegalense]|uniref:metal-dependent hydrolase n=1 Tax=Massilibacterium senegalense TaxID=1632858 RepID=UPI0007867BB4|nr:metal-dependent hydrolase [Massilibacterium senegalense]
MKITYFGHSALQIETNDKTILIDPFITGNGLSPVTADEVKPDVIFLTHGHGDHVGDTEMLAKKHDALVVAPFELATYLGFQGLRTHPMHIGGSHMFDFGQVKLTQAFHGSSIVDEEKKTITYMGMPCGILFTSEGKTIYHAGDTALFSDMKVLGELNDIDVAFLPIGDNFTMGIKDAVIASKWLQAKTVVPIHYDTFPVIEVDPLAFVERLEKNQGKIVKPGEKLEV